MQITGRDAHRIQIFGQVFSHALSQGRDQYTLMLFNTGPAFPKQIVNLPFYGTNLNFGIEQTGRTDDLFRHNALRAFQLPFSRRCRNIDYLIQTFQKFMKFQRPVIQSGRQPETKVHQRRFPGAISLEHAADLRNTDMGLVSE